MDPPLDSPGSPQKDKENGPVGSPTSITFQEDLPRPREQQQQRRVVRPKTSGVWFKQAEKITLNPAPSSSHVDDITNDLPRGAPTDGDPEAHLERTPSQMERARRRSQYYDDAFALRSSNNNPRNRVNQDAVVLVRIKTNVTVSDHFPVVGDLSSQLAFIFQRPESSMMVILEPSVPIMYGGSYEPAYFLSVIALPALIAPVTNLRNTMRMQTVMLDTLGIPENRGVVTFEPIPEYNLGTNSITFKEEIERLVKKGSGGGDGIIRTLGRTLSRKVRPVLPRINTEPSDSSSGPSAPAPARPQIKPFMSSPQVLQQAQSTDTTAMQTHTEGDNNETKHASEGSADDEPEKSTKKSKRVVRACRSFKEMLFRSA
ncbi:hypothetical protein VTO42DRAFT_3568 [Malbranchea cinnamomea]